MLFVTQVFILKETSDESRVEVNRSKFICMLFSFFFSRVTNDFRFFCPGELVLALKSSNLHGSVLLSMALFVSGEVLIGARAKNGLFYEAEFGKKFYFHGLQSAWGIIKSGKA